jgi:two-component system, NtrC family, sensor kinase
VGVRQLYRRLSLNAKLIASYLVILGVGGLAISVIGSTIVSRTIWNEAQRTVAHDLALARTVHEGRLELIRRTVELGASGLGEGAVAGALGSDALAEHLLALGRRGELDFLGTTDAHGEVRWRSGRAAAGDPRSPAPELVRAALGGETVAATELLSWAALDRESPELAAGALAAMAPGSPAAVPAALAEAGMAMIAAAPVSGPDGEIRGALYGGVLLVGDSGLVDRVFDGLYGTAAAPQPAVGTVTLYQGDVGIATSSRWPEVAGEGGVGRGPGERALGIRAPQPVARAVLDAGETSRGRAEVAGQRYLSAYEPVKNHAGEVVGMLQVGVLEGTYAATRNRVIASFFAIATVGFFLVIAVTWRSISALTRPIREMVAATRSIAAGRFDHPVATTADGEIGLLAHSFNTMQGSLSQMHHDLEEAARTLEEKVQARSEELVKMQARVAQSERLASLGMLAAGIAHEINNPLGGILALTSLALEDLPADDPNRENLEEVVRQTLRCSEIVKHLLEFSRQHRVSTERVDVNLALEGTLSLLQRQSIFFNVEVVKHLDPALPPIIADRSQLEQVLMNILMNAVQAMEEQGTLTVTTRHDTERQRVELTVADTGCGIPPEAIDRVFDPFFTTKQSGQGTGLGLSIAYGIVSRHQGTIAVESEPGKGTRFTIRLPAHAELLAQGQEPALLGAAVAE